jgi:glycosyltransferase involved in cell wall biosynthesis
MTEHEPNSRIALIVPMLNEAGSLGPLLSALANQTRRPDEIIFVDAGSSDGGPQLIAAWWERARWPGGSCRVEANPGGYPGDNRNLGVGLTGCGWIAFLDCGITPEPDWLEQLSRHAEATGSAAVYGSCDFQAEKPVARAICALSYGVGTAHPVLPASLFGRSVFAACGMFDPGLRAAEDRKWMAQVEASYGPKNVCGAARVHYSGFPPSLYRAARKYYLYQRHCIKAGLGGRSQVLYALAACAGLGTLALSPPAFGFGMGLYLLLRGVLDPVRRSRKRIWWGDAPRAVLLAPLAALTIDLAKSAGILRSYLPGGGQPQGPAITRKA